MWMSLDLIAYSTNKQIFKLHLSIYYNAVIPENVVSESVKLSLKALKPWFPMTNTLFNLMKN